MKSCLLVIDVQNDYFASAGGKFGQFDVDAVAARIAAHARQFAQGGGLVVGVQHLLPEGAPMFAQGSHGAALHESVQGVLQGRPLVQKRHADSFLNTDLQEILRAHAIGQIDICGIMTQNCVTHTALSPFAKDYSVRVLSNLCTAPSEWVHLAALDALKDRNWIEVA